MADVTPEDREAYLAMNMLPEFDAADVRAGLWDKVTGLQAFAAHREAVFKAGQDAERAAVVAWLMDPTRTGLNNRDVHIAAAIERGEHRETHDDQS